MTDDSGGPSAAIAEPSAGGFDEPMPDADRLSLHGSESVDAVHPAEQFCLSREDASPRDILHLISLLDSELPSRGTAGPNTFSWTSGAYAKGPLRGLRKHSRSFPACTRLLCRLVLQSFPDADFTAVAIFKNLQTALHVDVNNDVNSCNYLIPVTSFEGGRGVAARARFSCSAR